MPSLAMEQADAERFQEWIWQQQYPADCRATVGSFTPQAYFFALGLGAQMVSLKFNLLNALLQKQVYHFPTSHYVNPVRCTSRSFGCYFEQPTNCTLSKTSPFRHKRVVHSKIHWCFDLPRRRLSRLAGLHGVHSKAWYHAQLSAFLFRPNAELIAFGRNLIGNMEGVNSSRTAGGSNPGRTPIPGPTRAAVGNANGSCVALHIRRTDKHTEDHRTASRSFGDFAQLFKSWAYWAYPGVAGGVRAFIGSEDKVCCEHEGLTFASPACMCAHSVGTQQPTCGRVHRRHLVRCRRCWRHTDRTGSRRVTL